MKVAAFAVRKHHTYGTYHSGPAATSCLHALIQRCDSWNCRYVFTHNGVAPCLKLGGEVARESSSAAVRPVWDRY